MKKALHIGMSCSPDHHGRDMKQAFEDNGWEFKEIPTQSQDLNFQIINIANTYKPDLIWVQIQADGISHEAIKALKDNGGYIIGWSGDKRHRVEDCYFKYAQWGFDLTTFSNMEDVQIMKKCGYEADYLQIGVSPEIFNNTGTVNSICEICFMGNTFSHFPLSGMRREMVKELKRTYGDRFKAFGSGQPDGNFNSSQRDEAAVYRGAKIGINLSHFDTQRYTSDRLFRMLSCGILVVSHEYKGIYEDFNPHDMGIWRDFDELKSQIDYYLSNEDARVKIAANGHQKAVDKYSFRSMGENILALYNKYNP
jgi:glycosyltransferase involved in cell wall biosynthesis